MNTTVNISLRVSGFKEATRDVNVFKKALKDLHGARADVTISINGAGESIASQPMIVDNDFVNRALTSGMLLDPPMLAESIFNRRILPDKMAMFIAGINRELMREQTRTRGSKKLLRKREQYIQHYGLKFMYFSDKIGKPLNKVVTDIIRRG